MSLATIQSGDVSTVEGTLTVRRYRCLNCDAVLTVVPDEVCPGRRYLRTTIVLALAVWCAETVSLTLGDIRRTLAAPNSHTTDEGHDWRQFWRWIEQLPFPTNAASSAGRLPPRTGAEALVGAWGGSAHDRAPPLWLRAFHGAGQAV